VTAVHSTGAFVKPPGVQAPPKPHADAIAPLPPPPGVHTSGRVLAELDWVRTVIEQHQEALRGLQTAHAAGLDGAEQLTERVDSALAQSSARAAQLAASVVANAQADEAAHRQLSEGLNALQQRVVALASVSPAAPETVRVVQPEVRPRKVLAKLPPLVQNQRPESPRREDGSGPEFRVITMAPARGGVPGQRLTLVSAQFSINVGQARAQAVVTGTNVAPFDSFFLAAKPPGPHEAAAPSVLPVSGTPSRTPSVSALTRMLSFRIAPPVEAEHEPPTFVFRAGKTQLMETAAVADDLIEEKVSLFARKVVTLLTESAKAEMSSQAAELKKVVDNVMTMIESKIDRDFVERMFNKIRVMLTDMNEKIENVQCSFLEWVTRDELELVLQRFAGVVGEVQDAAAATAKYDCLLCGRKRTHVAGMMVSGEAPQASQQSRPRPKTAISMPKPRRPKVEPMPGGKDPDVGPTQKARDVVEFLTIA
jgi:hypothetical protein